ncbi:outer membrane beta-barrel protein [Massilia sp. TSP1-1-2]|uniref:outer membrane beta-barrel protein n=1 Tax=unclassified Massilia TaxID=2609279 RepID=UPI003CEA5226
MKKILFATLVAAATAAPAVHADPSAYVGLAVGAGSGKVTIRDGLTSLDSNNNPLPLNGYVGYAFHPNFAVEGGITFFGEYTFNGEPTALFGIFHAAIKGSMNLNDKWLLTGKVGVARQRMVVDVPGSTSFTFESTTPLLGVGTEYRFSERFSATLELNDYGTSNKREARMQVRNLEAGIKYRF